MIRHHGWTTVQVVIVCIFFATPALLHAQELQTGNSALATRIAPGESLPLTVRLSNFGSNERVDVTIRYEILDAKESVIITQTETVAVQTSASFIKQIPLPSSISPGLYTARTSIIYNAQRVPATATQQFTVERKLFGIFVSDLLTYVAILCIALLLLFLLILLLRRYRKQSIFAPLNYSHIPQGERVYYEIISDAIQQMRYHEGDAAVKLVSDIPGLTIDGESGKVIALTKNPSGIIATIVARYESTFGKHVNFSFAGGSESRAIVR